MLRLSSDGFLVSENLPFVRFRGGTKRHGKTSRGAGSIEVRLEPVGNQLRAGSIEVRQRTVRCRSALAIGESIMLVRVTQSYTRTVEIEGSRSAEIEAASIAEARELFAEGVVDWDDSQEEQAGVETELGDLVFEEIPEMKGPVEEG
jgi:hypothetical protein